MSDEWCIYHITNCHQSVPPKDKLVAIVCKDSKPMGFFINKHISPFVRSNPAMLAAQITIKASIQTCLDYDSIVDCANLIEFDESQLINKRESLYEQTVDAIKAAVKHATTVETHYRKLILGE